MILPWIAAAAVVLAIVASRRPRHLAAPARTIVNQVFFEAENQGKVVRLEMTVYRTGEKEGERNATKPLF